MSYQIKIETSIGIFDTPRILVQVTFDNFLWHKAMFYRNNNGHFTRGYSLELDLCAEILIKEGYAFIIQTNLSDRTLVELAPKALIIAL